MQLIVQRQRSRLQEPTLHKSTFQTRSKIFRLALFAEVEETRSEKDLDRTMAYGEELVALKAIEHSRHLKFLGDVLTLKYSMSESLEYLDRAVGLFEIASASPNESRLVDRCELLLSLR